jgi:uncharacterized protein (DUF2132 family)
MHKYIYIFVYVCVCVCAYVTFSCIDDLISSCGDKLRRTSYARRESENHSASVCSRASSCMRAVYFVGVRKRHAEHKKIIFLMKTCTDQRDVNINCHAYIDACVSDDDTCPIIQLSFPFSIVVV